MGSDRFGPRMSQRPNGSRRGLGAVLALALALSGASGLIAATTTAAAVAGPVLDRNFADPDVIKVGSTYHAYATNSDGRHIQYATSADLRSWSVATADALPVLGDWADPTCRFAPGGSTDTCVWAPDVSAVAGGGYLMYYTARDRASGKQCIGAARASTPQGPFAPAGTRPIVCTPEQGGSIDPASYVDGGRRYLLWKNDGNCCNQDTWLQLQPVTADGLTPDGSSTRLIKQDRAFEGTLVEAPVLWRRGSTYVLLYSANFFGNDSYITSYATASALTGPYTKAAAPLMSTQTFGGTVRGPGGQDVVVGPDGKEQIVFHGWNPSYSYRAMYAADLGWAGDLPVVRGSAVRYEAEDAAVTRAVVRQAAGANGGRAVAYIDYPDSRVTFSVYVPRTGSYSLGVRFGNGSQEGASHTLTVGGVSAGSIVYPLTGWDQWRTVTRSVNLTEGWNTLSLGKGVGYTELDSIDVT